MLVHPSSIDLSSRTLRFLTGQLTAKRRKIGTRWRRLPASRQALLALARLRCGDTYAQLAARFGTGIATVHRYIRKAVEGLSSTAPCCRSTSSPPIPRTTPATPGNTNATAGTSRSSPIRSDGCSGPRRLCQARLTIRPPRDTTEPSKTSPMQDSNTGRTRRIKEPADPSGCRFGATASRDGSAATTPPTPRSVAWASRPWPPSTGGASCGNSAAAPTESPTS